MQFNIYEESSWNICLKSMSVPKYPEIKSVTTSNIDNSDMHKFYKVNYCNSEEIK